MRLLRRDAGDGASQTPDANFIAMMKDFAASFAGKQATTADFQAVVERHMVRAMNATGDGKMDWFFRQWVYGAELPRYTHDLVLEPAGKGEVRVRGTVTQKGVSPDFRVLLPLYVDLGKGDVMRFGIIAMVAAVIAAFLYLRIMVNVWLEPADDVEPERVPFTSAVAIAGAAVFTLLVGVWPGWLLDATDTVTQYAR